MARVKQSSRKGESVKGSPMRINQKEQARQVKEITDLFDAMADDVERQLNPAMESTKVEKLTDVAMDANVTATTSAVLAKLRRKWDKIFTKKALSFTDKITQDYQRRTANNINATMKKAGLEYTMKVDSMSQRTRDIVKAASTESVNQIKTLSTTYMDSVASTVNYSITGNNSSFSNLKGFFHDNLNARYKTHKNKAKNLALEQTRNVYNTLAENRSIDAGMDRYVWRHAGGSKEPRHYHKNVLDGQEFSYLDPPVIDLKTGKKGNPGQIYFCRCYAEPVIDFTKMT